MARFDKFNLGGYWALGFRMLGVIFAKGSGFRYMGWASIARTTTFSLVQGCTVQSVYITLGLHVFNQIMPAVGPEVSE